MGGQRSYQDDAFICSSRVQRPCKGQSRGYRSKTECIISVKKPNFCCEALTLWVVLTMCGQFMVVVLKMLKYVHLYQGHNYNSACM